MKQSTIFFTFLFITSWCAPLASQPPMAPQQMMMPSEDDLIKMNQEIEAFRSSMTQEQRDEFDKQVEELSKVMENMSEKELEEFITTVFTNPDALEQPQPLPAPTPTPVAPPVVKETKPEEPLYKPSTVSAKTIEAAKALLLGTIGQIESFLRKANLIPDLYGQLQPWVPSAVLANKKELTWQELKQDIERLISSLKVILATDPATGHYYYLSSLVEHDALYQNLVNLNDALARNEPTIAITAFGLGDLTKESRKATGTLLSSFVQAIYTQQIISEIQKLFSAFEPQAKKVMEQEEAARKRAIEESKRTPMQAPMRSGGTLVDDYTSSTGYTPGLTDSYGYGGSSFVPPITPAGPASEPTTATPASTSALSPEKSPQAPVAKDEEKAKKEADEKKPKDEAIDKKTSDSAEKITEKIEGFIEECIMTIKAKKLDTTVMDKGKQEAVDEVAGKIARIISRIKTLESVLKDVPAVQKDVYMNRIKIMVKDEKDLFDTIISATDADKDNALRKQIEALFKKLDLTHTKKIIKPTPTKEQKKEPAKAAQPSFPVRALTSAEIHPASIPVETEEPVLDVHPAALRPAVPEFAEDSGE